VSDGVEHEAAQPLALFGGFGAGDHLDGMGTVDGDGDEPAEGFEGLGREREAAQDDDAAGTDAGAEGDDGLVALGGRGGDGGRLGEIVELGGGGLGRPVGTGAIDLVAIEQIEEDGVGAGGECDGRRDGVGEAGKLVGLEQGAAERVEDFEFDLAGAGLLGFFSNAVGETAGDDRCDEKDEEGQEVLGVGDGEAADGREEEEVVAGGGRDGGDDGVAQAPTRSDEEDEQKEGERDGGLVDADHEGVEGYNSSEAQCGAEPAGDRDEPL